MAMAEGMVNDSAPNGEEDYNVLRLFARSAITSVGISRRRDSKPCGAAPWTRGEEVTKSLPSVRGWICHKGAYMSDGLLKVSEVARLLRISDESVYRLCRRGHLEGATKIGGLWRVPRESVDRLLQQGQPLDTLSPAGDSV